MNERQAWYHGSPSELTILRVGSTVTQDRELARIFSHKPTIVSISDDGRIKHNGTRPGFLYRIAEEVSLDDIRPHPRSTMRAGVEWLTNRELRVELIGPTEVLPAEQLTEAEVLALIEIGRWRDKGQLTEEEVETLIQKALKSEDGAEVLP